MQRGARTLYALEKVIGRGAYSVVWSGSNRETGETVCVKVVTLREGAVKKDVERGIENEVALHRLLEGKSNVSELIDVSTEATDTWLLMKLASRGSLADILRDISPLEHVDVLKACVYQFMVGIAHIHEAGYIHRDVKGSNILFHDDGRVIVADYGSSIPASGKEKAISGSPYWLAPEVILSQPYDEKVDSWSVGITILECIAGKAPLSTKPPYLAMIQIANADYLPEIPHTVKDQYGEALVEVLQGCFVRDPSKRKSVKELLQCEFFADVVEPEPVIRRWIGSHVKKRRILQMSTNISGSSASSTTEKAVKELFVVIKYLASVSHLKVVQIVQSSIKIKDAVKSIVEDVPSMKFIWGLIAVLQSSTYGLIVLDRRIEVKDGATVLRNGVFHSTSIIEWLYFNLDLKMRSLAVKWARVLFELGLFEAYLSSGTLSKTISDHTNSFCVWLTRNIRESADLNSLREAMRTVRKGSLAASSGEELEAGAAEIEIITFMKGYGSLEKLEKGAEICCNDFESPTLYYVESGEFSYQIGNLEIVVDAAKKGNRIVLDGRILCFLASNHPYAHFTPIQCRSASGSLYGIKYNHFISALEQYPRLASFFYEYISKELAGMVRKVGAGVLSRVATASTRPPVFTGQLISLLVPSENDALIACFPCRIARACAYCASMYVFESRILICYTVRFELCCISLPLTCIETCDSEKDDILRIVAYGLQRDVLIESHEAGYIVNFINSLCANVWFSKVERAISGEKLERKKKKKKVHKELAEVLVLGTTKDLGSTIDEEEVLRACGAQRVQYKKGKRLMARKKEYDAVYLVRNGRAMMSIQSHTSSPFVEPAETKFLYLRKISTSFSSDALLDSNEKERVNIMRFTEGDYIGAMNFCDNNRALATVEVDSQNCVALVISRDVMGRLKQRDPRRYWSFHRSLVVQMFFILFLFRKCESQ